jgi:type III pantothenate kinase
VKPDVVVDVGNTRAKWGRCASERVAEMVSLAHDDELAWEKQLAAWQLQAGAAWGLSGVVPERCQRLQAWLVKKGFATTLLDSYRRLPLELQVDEPDKVGLDRLLNAVAANSARSADRGAIIVDAGTAVTVDYIDVSGRFCGGVIFPGFRLMARSLHDYTALLPVVEVQGLVDAPAKNTTAAIQSGIYHAVAGGVSQVMARLNRHGGTMQAAQLFMTGGDAAVFHWPALPMRIWPEMTLEGIRLSAEKL